MNVFDIIGPVMIGPSSSHTAGAARIGLIARTLLAEEPVKADILLHGSFAQTYRGHGTDKALLAGIIGLRPDDERLKNSLELANDQGISYTFHTGFIQDAHPNTAQITLTAASGHTCTLEGCSIGGGNILVTKIDGLPVEFSGQYTTLIIPHDDTPGMVANVAAFIAGFRLNIARLQLNRSYRGGTAVMTIELDTEDVPAALNAAIKSMPGVINSVIVRKI